MDFAHPRASTGAIRARGRTVTRRLRPVHAAALAAALVIGFVWAAAPVNAATPTITAPASATPGQTVAVNGTYFGAGQAGMITYNGGKIGSFAASSTGSFHVSIAIPTTATVGSTVRVSAKKTDGTLLATTTLAIVSTGATLTPPAAAGTAIVAPASAAPGGSVTVAGIRFAAGQTGNLTFNGVVVRTFAADSTGAFSVPFAIPTTATTGSNARISAKKSDGTLLATTTLAIVVAGATPSPSPTRSPTPSPSATPGSDPVVLAAGDVRTNLAGIAATTKVILGLPGYPVLNVGDDTADGSAALYASYFDPNWGQFRSRIWPTPGNHEYGTAGAAPYFAYYGARAGSASKSWYSFDLANNWHVVELNSNLAHGAGSAQELWLKADLAANAGRHIIAFWHAPRFSSGSEHGSDTSFTPFWNDLYAAHADIVLNGHDHDYERFALQNGAGQADANGIREWVVGMGGAPLYAFGTIAPNSQARQSSTYGVLQLTLGLHSYSWKFVDAAGGTYADSGTQATHS